MKSIIRVALPILLVAGLVFGITFIWMYSSGDQGPEMSQGKDGGKGAEQALKFFSRTAAASKPDVTPKHLQYWESESEVGAPGHFEFLCQNRHSNPVTVRVPRTNCQCAGAELAVIPPDAYQEYLVHSAVALGPFCPAPGPLAALAHAGLDRRLTWGPLMKGEDRHDQTVPAADPNSGPQFAFVKLAWTGKGEPGPKFIAADLYASIGDGTPSHTELGVETNVVPAFDMLKRDGAMWGTGREVTVGDLHENGVYKQTVYFGSATRPVLVMSIEGEVNDPCITWSEPVPASDQELLSLREFISRGEHPMRRIKTLYKTEVTVRERLEVDTEGKKELRQLDLGAFERKYTATAANAGNWALRVRGRVLGDVTFPTGAENGRIELGTSFPADQDRTRDVSILADRPGLDLTLVDAETVPNYLKAKLDLVEQIGGRNRYRLRVTVPKNTLFGALPENSVIVLKTNSTVPRRLRLPVRGMTFDSGGPRL
jgi:hypothetical protein